MRAIRLSRRLGLVAVLAIALLCLGVGFGVGGLESRFSSASDKTGELPITRLTALPHQPILDGTLPLRVRLSAPPAPFSPRPILQPAVAGTWATRGNSEIFTPASTLDPCANYTLTIPAASTVVAHSPLGKQRSVSLAVSCPSVKGLQQTLARLDYLPYAARTSTRASELKAQVAGTASAPASDAQAGISIDPAHVARRVAAIDAFDPSPDPLHALVNDAPPLEYGQLDETTKGASWCSSPNMKSNRAEPPMRRLGEHCSRPPSAISATPPLIRS
jgi:hypothetical protein